MKTLTVTVPLTPLYNSAYQQLVVINATNVTLNIPIQEGTNTWTSQYQAVGTLKHFADPVLMAAIRITYDYDSVEDTLDLFGNDYDSSSESTCLLTLPQGSSQLGQQHTYLNDPNPCNGNPNWNYTTPYTPGLAAEFTASIRAANDKIIEAAKSTFKAVCVKTPPPVALLSSKEGDILHNWTDMHAPDGTFLGVFDPKKEYEQGTTMKHVLQSTWGGEVTFNQDEYIANVIGSSGDPKISSKPWIELWERAFGMEDQCTSHNWAGGPATEVAKFNSNGKCNDSSQSNRVGGHVILGTVAKPVTKGSNKVYIIPICKNHNNNDKIYMRANVYTQGIWLNNYNK